MSRKEIAEKLKKIALEGPWEAERIKAMEALGEMGEEGVNALSEVGAKGRHWDEREKALDLAKKGLKERKEN